MTSDRERLRLQAYGVGVDVTVGHACSLETCAFDALAEQIRDRFPPGAVARSGGREPDGVVQVECRGDEISVIDSEGMSRWFADEALALHAIDGAIRSVVAVYAPGLVFIHAGAVAFDGRVIVLPGRSLVGKTTLVAALVEAGAVYLSDEYAPIDTDGLVHPYPRRLSMRTGGGRREVPAAELGGSTATAPLPIGLVASVRFQAGASWQVADSDQTACAEALLDNAVAARIRPAEVLATSARVARSARFLTGVRGEAADAARHLWELVMTCAG